MLVEVGGTGTERRVGRVAVLLARDVARKL